MTRYGVYRPGTKNRKGDAMSMSQSDMNANWEQPPAKAGMGCGAKLLILLGVLFLLLLVLCCGGMLVSGWYFGNSVSEDPDEIIALTQEIVDIEIPGELRPQLSFDMKVPFSGQEVMKWAVYADETTASFLVLASFGEALQGQDEEALADQIEQSLRQQGLASEQNVRDWERSTREIEVRGEPVSFDFATGEDADTGTRRIEVTGIFEGAGGPVLISFSGDAEKFPEETIVEMIESIR